MSTDEQAQCIAAHVADVLRQDDFKTALCNLQARGREFYIKHTTTELYYAKVHGWRSWEKSVDDACVFMTPCAIEVIRALEDIQHEQLIDRGLLEVCMTPIPNNVINPINVEGKSFAVLKSLMSKDVYLTMCKPDQNVAILANGRLAYDVVAFCDSYDEAYHRWSEALNGRL